ncbi:hypothetical protein ABT297_42490 [Dactylosporangium sp. NPDC000555]|uniref:hypothetical protein n=1 Tax=Dactylosporangium sp. NPDC000555 TaxID=3154260 RepID=UPI00333040FD
MAVQAVVLAYGGVVHVIQLVTGGWPPYPWWPIWLAVYFTSLTLLDPLAAALLVARRAIGLYLAAFILVTDAAANWYATYCLPGGTAVARIAQAVISVLALVSLLLVRYARPWMSRPRQEEPSRKT